jgi:glucan phosphoethanolaminetransferase (alkaline phosphatase superfamily)
MKERLGLLFSCYLVLNVSSAFQNVVIEVDFYLWSKATPFYNAIAATRTFFFGSYDTLEVNIPVLIGLFVFSTLLLLFMVFFNLNFLVPRGMGIAPLEVEEKNEK